MSPQSRKQVPDARRVRLVNTRPFILHNAHSKMAPTKGCSLCSGGMAKDAGILEIEVPGAPVVESSGADEERATPPARGYVRLDEIFGGELREEG